MSGTEGKGRASIFGDDVPADLDLTGFEPRQATSAPPRATIRAVSEAERFVSREAVSETPLRRPRRRRSRRTAQLNVKVTPETLDAFYAIAEAQDWLVAEAFEYAVAALQEKVVK